MEVKRFWVRGFLPTFASKAMSAKYQSTRICGKKAAGLTFSLASKEIIIASEKANRLSNVIEGLIFLFSLLASDLPSVIGVK